MERDIEKIRVEIEQFMERYNCYVRVETTTYGRRADGTLIAPKAQIIINS